MPYLRLNWARKRDICPKNRCVDISAYTLRPPSNCFALSIWRDCSATKTRKRVRLAGQRGRRCRAENKTRQPRTNLFAVGRTRQGFRKGRLYGIFVRNAGSRTQTRTDVRKPERNIPATQNVRRQRARARDIRPARDLRVLRR